MVWTAETSCGFESQKIWPLALPFCHGVGLDIGCGNQKCLPHMIGVDSGKDGLQVPPDIKAEAHDLAIIAPDSLDFIFSSHLVEHYPKELVPALLEHWLSKLKVGGHLVLYLPSANHYPKVGEPGANPDHKWDIEPGDIWRMICEIGTHVGANWLLSEERSEGNEYSTFDVFQKTGEIVCQNLLSPQSRGEREPKTAAVFRYGAIGDVFIASAVIEPLFWDDYEITVFTSPVGEQVLRHDPRIHRIYQHSIDNLPGRGAIDFYEFWENRFDKTVNLDHSLEGPLLGHERYMSHRWPIAARRHLMGKINYVEMAHLIAGYPGCSAGPDFYATDEELDWARFGRSSIGKDEKVVLWAITGSAINKVYPWVNIVAGWLVNAGVNVVFAGAGEAAQALEYALVQTIYEQGDATGRLYPRVGLWSIRQSMTFAKQVADVVVGPETGLLNGVSMDDVAKVLYLSHSSYENLSKGWCRTMTLLPDSGRCPCFPCHNIHYDWSTCWKNEETLAAQCASSIAPIVVYDAIMKGLSGDIPLGGCQQEGGRFLAQRRGAHEAETP